MIARLHIILRRLVPRVALLGLACSVHAGEAPPGPAPMCLPSGDGYVRARISGALEAELSWDNDGAECTGAVRPSDGGVRMRFRGADPLDDGKLIFVFGIANLQEGRPAKLLPVNVTLVREGKGEFYSTQGDDKCMLEDVRQQPLVGIAEKSSKKPIHGLFQRRLQGAWFSLRSRIHARKNVHEFAAPSMARTQAVLEQPANRSRSYRITARGFCTEPARAVRGEGAVLLSRFDIAGRVDFESEDDSDDASLIVRTP